MKVIQLLYQLTVNNCLTTLDGALFEIFRQFLKNSSGLDKIEFLQSHENLDIYQKAFEIIQHYFGTEEEDARVAPSVDSDQQQYHFSADQSVPMGGFHF